MSTEAPEPTENGLAGGRIEDQVRACLVRSGTSRFIVVNRQDAPSDLDERTLALELFGGNSVADGLGGDHYQLNKLAIWQQTLGGELEFTFFSLAPGSRVVSRGAQCGHAAVAVALVSEGRRPASERGGPVRVRNVDTGQILEVSPRSAADEPIGSCHARIIHEPPVSMANGTELVVSATDHDEIRWEAVAAGNIFALIPGRQLLDDPKRRREIQAVTLEWARTESVPNASEEFVRSITYDVQWETPTHARIDAVCHNGDERHNSLPVSGSSALCDHLTLKRLLDRDFPTTPDREDIEFVFHVTSVSGTEVVEVHASHRSGSWTIQSTSCTTNARLLIEGIAFLSP